MSHRSNLSAMLLRLAAERPDYSLGFQARLAEHACFVELQELYTVLRALERDGELESYEVHEALELRGGRPRRYYRPAKDGARKSRKRGRNRGFKPDPQLA